MTDLNHRKRESKRKKQGFLIFIDFGNKSTKVSRINRDMGSYLELEDG